MLLLLLAPGPSHHTDGTDSMQLLPSSSAIMEGLVDKVELGLMSYVNSRVRVIVAETKLLIMMVLLPCQSHFNCLIRYDKRCRNRDFGG